MTRASLWADERVLPQQGALLAQHAPGQLRQHLGVAFPADQGGEHGRARDLSTSEATESSLMPASSRVLCTRWHSAVCAWMSFLR